MNMLSWIIQLVFGAVFFAHGVALIVKPATMRTQIDALPYGRGFLSFIGGCEVLGGLGLLLPMWTGSAPWLTPLAAAGLAIIMAGAVWTHVSANERLQTTVTTFITLLLVLVVVVRWPLLKNLV
jgi:uncharacterized membrane protein YphA (DoxX/SURF4 family)